MTTEAVRPQPQYVWANVYRSREGKLYLSCDFETRVDADDGAMKERVGRIRILIEARFDEMGEA